jgi:hypothetical protein
LCVANFSLPGEEGSPFTDIQFVELARDEAKEVVDLYNKVSQIIIKLLNERLARSIIMI